MKALTFSGTWCAYSLVFLIRKNSNFILLVMLKLKIKTQIYSFPTVSLIFWLSSWYNHDGEQTSLLQTRRISKTNFKGLSLTRLLHLLYLLRIISPKDLCTTKYFITNDPQWVSQIIRSIQHHRMTVVLVIPNAQFYSDKWVKNQSLWSGFVTYDRLYMEKTSKIVVAVDPCLWWDLAC